MAPALRLDTTDSRPPALGTHTHQVRQQRSGLRDVQVLLLLVIGLVLGWTPRGSFLDVALLLALGTAAFSGLGLLMAGTLRAEATLAGANLIFLLLLVGGGGGGSSR